MKAKLERDGCSWVAALDGGGVTQAKRLGQLRPRLAEVVKLMTGETVDPDSIELDVKLEHDLGAKAVGLVEVGRKVEEQAQWLAAETVRVVKPCAPTWE